jgi:hypothetical protein
MSKLLKISDDLKLPIEAITQTFGIVAQRGAGKTYLTAVLCEEFGLAGLPFVAIDPMGVYYGLRSSSDGKHEGLPVIILGGEHGDVPLESTSGKVIADWVATERRSAVLDLSLFGKNEQRRFVTDFAEQLYHRNRDPLHLILDESDLWAPQKPKGVERMLGAIEDLVRRGRARGIGLSLVTQRPAVLNKDVLTQVSVLIALRIVGPQDQAAVKEWIKYHGEEGEQAAVMSSLSSLPIGTAWFWSPGWLGLLKKVQIRKRQTFDSSATPKIGERVIAPEKLAPVDLEVLRGRIAATIEKAKAEDPRELRKTIRELTGQIEGLKKRIETQPIQKAHTVEVPVLTDDHLKRLEVLVNELRGMSNTIRVDFNEWSNGLCAAGKEIGDAIAKTRTPMPVPPRRVTGLAATSVASSSVRPVREPSPRPREAAGIGKAEQRIIDSLAWWESIGIVAPARIQVAFVAGYTVNGHFNNLCGALRTSAIVEYPQGNRLSLTPEGRNLAAAIEYLSTRDDLHRRVREKISAAQQRLFDPLIEATKTGEGPLSNEELASRAGYTVNGHFNNLRGSLRSLGLIDYVSGGTVASELFFPPGLD